MASVQLEERHIKQLPQVVLDFAPSRDDMSGVYDHAQVDRELARRRFLRLATRLMMNVFTTWLRGNWPGPPGYR